MSNLSSHLLKKSLSFIDLCSGIGGGRVALENQGFICKNYSEINDKAIQSYKLLYKENHNGLGDLKTIDNNSFGYVDLVVAGFPCQSYSIAGKRQGLNDDRGQIIYDIANILEIKNVPYFIFENVKGLLNINNGKDFSTILNLLTNLNYNVYYKVLNSVNFGVPHSRERVYLVGIKKELDNTKFTFPKPQTYAYNLKDFLSFSEKVDQSSMVYATFLKYLNNKYNTGKFNIENLLSEDFLILDHRQSDLRLYRGYLPTIRKGRQGLWYVFNGDFYILSKEDALKLQGFNNEACVRLNGVSKSVVLEQVGNSMTINVIEAIIKELKKVIYK